MRPRALTSPAEAASSPMPEAADERVVRERGLVRRAQAGELDAFEQLYRVHAGRVFALCLRMTADQQRARELTQDVFVRAWEGLASFRQDAAFGSWLHRIAVNALLMGARADKRRHLRVALAGDLDDDGVDGLAAPVDVEHGIDLERA